MPLCIFLVKKITRTIILFSLKNYKQPEGVYPIFGIAFRSSNICSLCIYKTRQAANLRSLVAVYQKELDFDLNNMNEELPCCFFIKLILVIYVHPQKGPNFCREVFIRCNNY